MNSAFAGAAFLLVFALQPALAANEKNHPAIAPYEGSVLTRRDDDGHRKYAIVVAVNPKGKKDAELLQAKEVEGNVVRLAYENPKGRSAPEIASNYREAMTGAGFEILFSCAEGECGPGYAAAAWGRVTGLRYHSSSQHYVVAKASRNGQDIYVAVLVAPRRHQIDVVEVGEMSKNLVSANALVEGMTKEGRVVLDGIFFDTDKATLKSESKTALEAIARYLKDNPSVKAYIVGHTDTTGAFAHNMSLSKARAAAVVAALVRNHGVEAKRLLAQGIGPLSPRGPNFDESGRAGNRRVEMVQR